MVYHVLNRANFRSRLFKQARHYEDFLGIVEESLNFVPMPILAYCLMPNHWHVVLYPRGDGDLSKFGGEGCREPFLREKGVRNV
jgi:putative transposase